MKRFLPILLLFISARCHAGDNVRVKGHRLIIVPYIGGLWQGAAFGEIELGHPFNIHYVSPFSWRTMVAYTKIGAECNTNFKHLLWAPRFSAEIDISFICLRGSLEDYTEPHLNKVYGTPEAGLTLAGFITVCYGYNYPLLNSGFTMIRPMRIEADIMLPFKLSGSSRYKKQHV
jgi:hypothetical protein